jgi:hypothetical protein
MLWLARPHGPWLAAATTVIALVACNAVTGIGDYDFGQGAATASTTGTAGTTLTGGQGGTGATGGQGGTGAVGGQGGTGASGGEGGSGGQAPVLVDRGLVVRYFMDEAPSGQSPTQMLDSAPSPFHLGLDYSAQMAYAATPNGRGLDWTAVAAPGSARGTISGSKVQTALHGSATATIELVVNATDLRQGGNTVINALGSGSNAGDLSLYSTTNHGGNQVGVAWHGGTEMGYWPVDLRTVGRVVLDAVVDSTQADGASRLLLFVDGVSAGAASGSNVTQNATVDLSSATTLSVGNGVALVASIEGGLYYAALYSSALSQSEISINVTRLQASDDTTP